MVVEQALHPAQLVHVVAVPPSEYVKDPHAVHLLLPNLYPALHVVQTPVVVEQALHPVHVAQVVAVPPVEYVMAAHARH